MARFHPLSVCGDGRPLFLLPTKLAVFQRKLTGNTAAGPLRTQLILATLHLTRRNHARVTSALYIKNFPLKRINYTASESYLSFRSQSNYAYDERLFSSNPALDHFIIHLEYSEWRISLFKSVRHVTANQGSQITLQLLQKTNFSY